MALTFRLAKNTDAPAIVALVTANDADLVADYGSYVQRTAAEIRQMIADGNAEVIVGANNGTIVGACLYIRHALDPYMSGPDCWECLLTVTDPTFTAAQRLHGFWQMLIWMQGVAPDVIVWGRVKADRRLDNALSTITTNTRVDTGDGYAVHYGPVAPLNPGQF